MLSIALSPSGIAGVTRLLRAGPTLTDKQKIVGLATLLADGRVNFCPGLHDGAAEPPAIALTPLDRPFGGRVAGVSTQRQSSPRLVYMILKHCLCFLRSVHGAGSWWVAVTVPLR